MRWAACCTKQRPCKAPDPDFLQRKGPCERRFLFNALTEVCIPVLTDEQKSRIQAMKPMTKEEWDARQSVIRKVVDPETGRTRYSPRGTAAEEGGGLGAVGEAGSNPQRSDRARGAGSQTRGRIGAVNEINDPPTLVNRVHTRDKNAHLGEAGGTIGCLVKDEVADGVSISSLRVSCSKVGAYTDVVRAPVLVTGVSQSLATCFQGQLLSAASSWAVPTASHPALLPR